MKALILDGSQPGRPPMERARDILIGKLSNAGWLTETCALGEMDIAPCMGCFHCWLKTPGQCVIKDDGRAVARSFVNADLAVLLTPVTFGGYSWHLKKALDRIICVVSPFFTRVKGEIHHSRRYETYPRLLGVGVQLSPDAEAARVFSTLVRANSLNIHSPKQASAVLAGRHGRKAMESKISEAFNRLEVRA